MVGAFYLLPGLIPVSRPPTAAVMGDTCPLRGLLGCLPDTPVGRPGLAAVPSGSSSSSPPRARGQGSSLPISEYDPARGPQGAGLVLGLRPRTGEDAGCSAPLAGCCVWRACGTGPDSPSSSPGQR